MTIPGCCAISSDVPQHHVYADTRCNGRTNNGCIGMIRNLGEILDKHFKETTKFFKRKKSNPTPFYFLRHLLAYGMVIGNTQKEHFSTFTQHLLTRLLVADPPCRHHIEMPFHYPPFLLHHQQCHHHYLPI